MHSATKISSALREKDHDFYIACEASGEATCCRVQSEGKAFPVVCGAP